MKVISNFDDFNASKVPDSEIRAIAKVLLSMVDKFMAQPGMQERYEEWEKQRAAQAAPSAE